MYSVSVIHHVFTLCQVRVIYLYEMNTFLTEKIQNLPRERGQNFATENLQKEFIHWITAHNTNAI